MALFAQLVSRSLFVLIELYQLQIPLEERSPSPPQCPSLYPSDTSGTGSGPLDTIFIFKTAFVLAQFVWSV